MVIDSYNAIWAFSNVMELAIEEGSMKVLSHVTGCLSDIIALIVSV